jgi:predicted deacylase
MAQDLEQKTEIKKRIRPKPLDIIYHPLPKFARKPFADFVVDLHSASSTLTDAYENAKAWVYRTFSGFYMAG